MPKDRASNTYKKMEVQFHEFLISVLIVDE
jgi:hypothetical protein